jgi:tetratricopeptide (TPR) repeat protein
VAAGGRAREPGQERATGSRRPLLPPFGRGWGPLGTSRAPGMVRALGAPGAMRFAAALRFAAAVALPFLVLPRAAHMVQGNRAAAQARGVLEQGNLEEAERTFRDALELTPRSHEAAVFLAGLLLERGEPDEALAALDLAAQGGASPEECLLRAEALRQRGELRAAVDVLDRAVAILPHLVRAHFLLGEIHDEMGDLEAARLAYRNVVERAGRFPAAEPWAELARGRLAVIEAWDGEGLASAPAPHPAPIGAGTARPN